ncbi:MAG: hypothetical protein MK086_07105 [Flavobacteriales bacterium]|nr:hypothetical protein [Flavobacteriales bacterium]
MSKPFPCALVLFLICFTSDLKCQYFSGQNSYWKSQRHSLGASLGASFFLGELGGRDQEGTGFIYDLELSKTRPAIQLMYRYQLGSRVYAKAHLGVAFIGGNDALTEEKYRRNRNLHFRSTVFEFAISGEVVIIDLTSKNKFGRVKSSKLQGSSIYITAGVGIARFNPQGNFEGTWYDLRDFGTEGQFIDGGPSPYSQYTVILPFGIGYRLDLDKQWSLGFEVVHRTTFTDYMDDVSTDYFNNQIIKEEQGELAAFFADPSLGFFLNEDGVIEELNSTFNGAQRGDPDDNDAYFFASFTAYYKLSTKRFKKGRGRVTKRRRRRVVF